MSKVSCILLLSLGMITPAVAESVQCGPKLAIAKQLSERFGEVPIVSGISMSSSMKFFGNPRTGSWSLILIKPNGVACVVATGEDLEVSSLAYAQNISTRAF